MNAANHFKLIGISLLLAIGLSACDKPGPAETAGRKIDQTADEAGRKINEAADKIGDKIGEQGLKTTVAMNDSEITAKVKAAIFAEPGLKTLQISVETLEGVVTLTGSVDSPQNADRAGGLAGAVGGVNRVENRLVEKSGK